MNPYAELVRLPAVLSAPGDPLLGAASGAAPSVRETSAAVASSALAYMAGMALNDFADRHIDAAERPHRPIPSGRISSNQALAVGVGLLAADLAVAWTCSGRRAALYSLATGTVVLTYDFAAKNTAAGPWAMAACRFLDVQRGSPSFRAGLWPASLVAAHTYVITRVSRDEVGGSTPALAHASAASTAAIAAATLLTAARTTRPPATQVEQSRASQVGEVSAGGRGTRVGAIRSVGRDSRVSWASRLGEALGVGGASPAGGASDVHEVSSAGRASHVGEVSPTGSGSRTGGAPGEVLAAGSAPQGDGSSWVGGVS
ncbi:UbiA family prenyltransferase, partial [Kineosporia rhizophila]|uniref:UbiA family prenyltransferase n=1 Tax=Kineosporia rhizophila TaxID=84633 RepID=UPI001E4478FD|nr:UbiA family prenyltransferase [Kineosporia rhizophila]